MSKQIIPIPADTAAIAKGKLTITNNSVVKATIRYSEIHLVTKTAAATASAASQTMTVALTAAHAVGDKFRVTLQDTIYSGQGSRESFAYTSIAGDTVTLIADALSAKIDASARFTGSNVAGVITAAVSTAGGQLVSTTYTSATGVTFVNTTPTAGVADVGKASNMTAEGMTAAEQALLGTVTQVYTIETDDSIYKVYAESAAVTAIDALVDGKPENLTVDATTVTTSGNTIKTSVEAWINPFQLKV